MVVFKVKEEIEDISGAKTDATIRSQDADDPKPQLNQQPEQDCCMMRDRPQLREQSSNKL